MSSVNQTGMSGIIPLTAGPGTLAKTNDPARIQKAAQQFEALLIGLFALIPSQSAAVLGVEFAAAGLGVLAAIRIFGHYFPEDERSHVLGSTGARWVREILIHAATLLPVVCGVSLLIGLRSALYWLIPAEIISLYLSFGLAWVFAIEIPRRREQQKRPPSP